MRLSQGDHACCIYTTPAELVATVADFVVEGLQKGERCWYVASGDESAAIVAALEARRISVSDRIHAGALTIIPSSQAYPVHDTFEPERSMAVFSDAIEAALADGFTGFRAAAEMSWALGPDGPTDQLMVYEALLCSLFSSARVTGLCLYPRIHAPLRVLDGALLTHPVVGVGDQFHINPFYDETAKGIAHADGTRAMSRLTQLAQRDDPGPKTRG